MSLRELALTPADMQANRMRPCADRESPTEVLKLVTNTTERKIVSPNVMNMSMLESPNMKLLKKVFLTSAGKFSFSLLS